MTTNEAADRLAGLSAALLLVMTAWGNAKAMICVSLLSLGGFAFFYARYGKSVRRTGLWTILVSALVSAAMALIAWKVKL